MRNRLVAKLLFVGLFAAFLAACGSTKVQRNTAETQTELTGRWNANDSRKVSQTMITSMLDSPWLARARRDLKRAPVVIVGDFRNLSSELISVETFTADIERALINSGDVQFVASKHERGQLREEKNDQETNAKDDTRKESGQETGADFMLTGTINSFTEQRDGDKNIQYQIDVTLIDLQSNRKVWVDSQKHGKSVTRSRFGL